MKYKRKEKYKTLEAQLAAVKQSGFAIEHIHNPSEAVQLAAVKQHYRAIRYIHNPLEGAQLEAVKNNGFAINYIDNPSEEVIDFLKNEHIEIFDEYFEEVK